MLKPRYTADRDADNKDCPVVRNYRAEIIAYCPSITTARKIAAALQAQHNAKITRRQARLALKESATNGN